MKKTLPFRVWFYFRNGWSTYFAFIFAAINTLTVTYFLAVENYPFLKEAFPSFLHYVLIISSIGIPLLVGIGYIHFKKSQAYTSEADIVAEVHPLHFRLPPGWHMEVLFPLYLKLSQMMIKWSKDEKLNDEEIQELSEIQKKIDILIKGGYIGQPYKKMDTDYSQFKKS